MRLGEAEKSRLGMAWRAKEFMAWQAPCRRILKYVDHSCDERRFNDDVCALPQSAIRVGCRWGRNDTLRQSQRLFRHLYSPLIRRCPHPRGEVWARISGETGKPASLRLATASPNWAVFQ